MGEDDLGPAVSRRGKELRLHRIDHGVDEQPLAGDGGGDRHHRVDEQQLRSSEGRGGSGPPQDRVDGPDQGTEEEQGTEGQWPEGPVVLVQREVDVGQQESQGDDERDAEKQCSRPRVCKRALPRM